MSVQVSRTHLRNACRWIWSLSGGSRDLGGQCQGRDAEFDMVGRGAEEGDKQAGEKALKRGEILRRH